MVAISLKEKNMSQTQSSKTTDHQPGVAPGKAKAGSAPAKTGIDVKDALAEIRAGAQDLHRAVTDSAAKRGGAMKADLETLPQRAKAIIDAIKTGMNLESEATMKLLTRAASRLEDMQKQLAIGLRSDGHAFEAAVRQAVADSRASVQHVSEALATKRSEKSVTKTK